MPRNLVMYTFHVSLQVALFALSISQGGLPEPQWGWHGFVTLCTLEMSQYLIKKLEIFRNYGSTLSTCLFRSHFLP